ncbi:fungal-specific transcription factor domain-containing protein [Phascolomyces articulosus]|uniref:Fungal-specific transcription factor domain-containing protein n=1 Tax=Phascolomyces articulosus TaxID=60185 RepID=A0AAD5K2D8_9FUNG|nr:fungal-specific transcription factor domain-containing protein [Phascolomyces articulosus]
MSAYGQYIQEPLYRPTKVPGRPQQPLFQPGTIQIWPPTELISLTDQDKLLELYFEHVHTSMPILDVITMNQELAKCRANNDCFLSPLFFYALFALASRHARQDNPLYAMGDTFMQQAVAHRDGNFGYPCIASVLGLLLMVEYLQQMRDRPHASYAWMLAREAIGMVTDLGIYKPCNVSPDPDDQELAVRTFWAAFTTDRLMSLTYGRPFVFEEKDMYAFIFFIYMSMTEHLINHTIIGRIYLKLQVVH